MFIAALWTIAKVQKQPRCLLSNEWIKIMWCLHTVEFYSFIKEHEIFPLQEYGWNGITTS
jgi:hypothetical protein